MLSNAFGPELDRPAVTPPAPFAMGAYCCSGLRRPEALPPPPRLPPRDEALPPPPAPPPPALLRPAAERPRDEEPLAAAEVPAAEAPPASATASADAPASAGPGRLPTTWKQSVVHSRKLEGQLQGGSCCNLHQLSMHMPGTPIGDEARLLPGRLCQMICRL